MEHHQRAQDSFMKAYDQYADGIYRFCAMKVSNRELAHDLTQEVFMRYWQSMRKEAVVENERAFLYTLARNLVIDWYRKKKETSLDELAEAGIEFGSNDHKQITVSAEAQMVLAAIDKIDEASREVLLLRFVEGFTPKDIAEMTGESANAISVRLNRAVKKVQEILHIHE
jgi:RNA polymerase sigma-70 factor (ECF subfamily)